MTDALKIDIEGNARGTLDAMRASLAQVEERTESLRDAFRQTSAELRKARKDMEDLAKVQGELKTPELIDAAKTAYDESKRKVDALTASVQELKREQKSSGATARELRDGIRGATSEAKKLEDATAKGVKRGLEAARTEAERLTRGLEEAIGLQRRASSAGGGASLGLSTAGAAASLASGALHAAAEAAKEWIATIPEGAAASERHQIALRALGGSYQQVQAATQGAVSAEQAYRLEQEIAQSGLSLTGRELAVVTGRARDYARATGTDVQQAIDRLSEGLRSGSNEQLRRFGIVVEQGSTRTHTFRSALQQLEAQEGHTAHAALTVTEAQEQLTRATTELSQSLQAIVAERIGLAEFFSQAASWVRDLTDNTRSLSGELRNAAAAVGLLDTARAQHINQSQSGEFVQQFSAARERLQALGGDVSRIGAIGQFAVNATPAQRQQALDAINAEIRQRSESRSQGIDPRTQRAGRGLFGDTNLQGVQDVSGSFRFNTSLSEQLANIFHDAAQDAETRHRDESQRAEKAERERQQALTELQRRERAAQSHTDHTPDAHAIADALRELLRQQSLAIGAGGALGSAERSGARNVDLTPSSRLEELRRRATDTTPRAHENELQQLQRLVHATQEYTQALREQQQVEKDAAHDLEALHQAAAQAAANELAFQDTIRRADEEHRRQIQERFTLYREQIDASAELLAAQGREDDATRRRAEDLDHVRVALEELLTETDARITQAREEGRAQGEINDLIRERIGLQHSLSQVTREQTEAQAAQHTATTAWKDAMVGALGQTTEAFAAASIAAWQQGKSWGDAMEEMLRASLAALAKQSIVETLKATALGFVALAQGNVPAATSAFTGAAIWAATGLAAGGTLAAIGPSAEAKAKGAAASSTPAPRAAQLSPSERTGNNGSLNLTINVSGALFNEGVEDHIVRGLDRAHARGVLPRFARTLNA